MSALARAIADLTAAGFAVESADDIPGLYRVNGGPELTARQVMDFAARIRPPASGEGE